MGMIGVATAVLSVSRSGRTVRQWRHVPGVSASSVDASVLAVVPARNEVVESTEPAPGRAGKTHAMHLGVASARDEEWLVFEGSPPDGRGATALAVGHCILVRRAAFDAAGGWEAIASTHADDVGLGTLIRDSGGFVKFVDASALLTTSGIDTVGDCWRSLRKSVQPAFREMFGPWGRVLLVVAGLLHLAYGLVPVLRWRSPWSWLAWLAQTVPHREFLRRNGQPETAAVLAPLSWATIGVFLLDCALRPGAQWKDRRVG